MLKNNFTVESLKKWERWIRKSSKLSRFGLPLIQAIPRHVTKNLENAKFFHLLGNTILENERNQFDKELILAKICSEPKKSQQF